LKGKILNVEKARFDKMLGSAEVGTLITALGCGIGSEEFNPEKLRYHSIIIMTDADVDGSHIRTLLLTFFFRQMRELVERGHIFIAQPPLYKIAKGKQEQYLKDDDALMDFLTNAAVESTQLHVNVDAPALPGTQFEALVKDYRVAQATISKLSALYPEIFLERLITNAKLSSEDLAQKEKVQEWADEIVVLIEKNNLRPSSHQYSIQVEENRENHLYEPTLIEIAHGTEHRFIAGSEFFESSDYQKIKSMYETLSDLIEDGAYVSKGEKQRPVENFGEALDWVMNESKKGYMIQRYKGLGEMNPDQLWDTTMNPETRRMLRVDIEDAIAADQIFSTLMGDQVEPRREFIETNALNVANLDI